MKTHRGLTVPKCTLRFALIGAVAGITSGVVMATLDLPGFNATAIMLTPGLMFGIGLSFAIDRYIGVFAVTRRVILIPGCLAGFGLIGVVIEFTIFRFTYPIWNSR